MSVIETACGRVRGASVDGVHVFKGIPYADDTGGAHRFGPPRPFTWTGVRDALECGPRSPQNERAAATEPYRAWLTDSSRMGEDCLVLNVFTTAIGAAARQPVMVYLHGGAFASGSGGAPGIDGSNLARRGVVVVTVNHRLNLFGHLYLGDDERYVPNPGLHDLVAALRWVAASIAAFGGDPGNVTIFGQSGGGSKVAALMAMPAAHGLFHKAIIQSASSLLAMATPEEAARNTDHFLAALGLDRARRAVLHTLLTERMLAAMPVAIRAAGRIDDFRPVVDGRTLPTQPFAREAVALSADVPLLTGWCENEQRLTFATTPEVYRQSEVEARAAVAEAVGIDEPAAAHLMAVYREGRPDDSPGDLHAQIYGDQRYRRGVTRAAELQVVRGGASAYVYLLRWKTPVMGGRLRAPHTLCIPFAFGNVDRAVGITGGAPDRYRLETEMRDAWVAFARTGEPNHAGLPAWPRYDTSRRPTMILDRSSVLAGDPLRDERLALDACPRYVPRIGEGRLR